MAIWFEQTIVRFAFAIATNERRQRLCICCQRIHTQHTHTHRLVKNVIVWSVQKPYSTSELAYMSSYVMLPTLDASPQNRLYTLCWCCDDDWMHSGQTDTKKSIIIIIIIWIGIGIDGIVREAGAAHTISTLQYRTIELVLLRWHFIHNALLSVSSSCCCRCCGRFLVFIRSFLVFMFRQGRA